MDYLRQKVNGPTYPSTISYVVGYISPCIHVAGIISCTLTTQFVVFLKIPTGEIRIHISKKNRHHKGQIKKYKRTNNDLLNIHIKRKLE